MVVSTLRPPSTAASDAPAPRWHVTMRRPSSGRPSSSAAATGAVGVRQPVEAVAANRVSVAPFAGHRVGRGRSGDGRVERGVEAGHGRDVGQLRGDGVERGEGLGLVQWGEVGQLLQLLSHCLVDADRAGERRAPMHDAMTDRGGLTPALQGFDELGGVDPVRSRREICAAPDVVVLEQAQLQARGSGVDDQYEHRSIPPDQVQSAMAGSSSPCSRV